MTLNSNLAQQLAQKSGEPNVNQLNDMLECISLMRIQFNCNKDQYNKMKNQVKQAKAAQTVYLEQLYEYKAQVKQLKIDYGMQTAKLQSATAQVDILKEELEKMKHQKDIAEMKGLSVLLAQQENY